MFPLQGSRSTALLALFQSSPFKLCRNLALSIPQPATYHMTCGAAIGNLLVRRVVDQLCPDPSPTLPYKIDQGKVIIALPELT
jgi:hypothetical protein